MTPTTPTVIGPTEGRMVQLQTVGVRHMIPAEAADGRFSLVEHPMSAKGLAAPLHRHNREDEYSFVLEGRMGALLGDDVVYAEPGDLVYKPRGQWHTFWNAGDGPARILEIISPAGFERFFDELALIVSDAAPDPARFAELCGRYALDMDPDSVPGLCERFGLWFPMPGQAADMLPR
jgi:mannose-6-phosphate isomerase-like protein (cupin superfamily)